MNVELSHVAEAKRQKEKLPKWGLLTTKSVVEAVHFARDNGWKDKKVQVRFETTINNNVQYIVEPYEEGCGCRGLLRYKDYYETEDRE